MHIGELARRSGMAPSAIRFYESIGLLRLAKRQANGYRAYPPEAVALLALIGDAQQAGFTLDEIKQILPDDLTGWQHEALLAALARKVADIEAMQARLQQSKAHLQGLIELIAAKPEAMDCHDNAARVLASLGLNDGQNAR